MQTNELNREKLRELAETRPGNGTSVLSLFLNLDPSEFATPPARETEIRSLIDDAERSLRDADELSHEAREGLKQDIARARDYLSSADFSGAHGLAIFSSLPAGLFEAIKLPRPVRSRAVIDDSPFVEPLADLGKRDRWAILLVNRQTARMLRGSKDGFEELPPLEDDVHGQHDQGGWSQARYQRSVDKEVQDHLKHTSELVFRRFKREPFDRLLLGGPEEILGDTEERLHPYVRERVAGRIEIDVENTTPEQVRDAAAPVIEVADRNREREALDRVVEGVQRGGRAAAGLDDTLGVLNERRVETLMLNAGFAAAGKWCPKCGSVYSDNGDAQCPADGTALQARDNIMESAVELALMQSADVLVMRHLGDELEPHGSIAAVLRF
ncbi:MAG: Vms1/Ankzf1 family peptidyl-tRNA hydrolase [Thermoleophilaceae bacterium]|jgi:peptide chain release factor subunit 1